jgi:hypothetical protein
VTPEQIDSLNLTPMPGKRSDVRAGAFEARYGELVQVEVEAIHPDTLRRLYEDAINALWDVSAFDQVREREAEERAELEALLERYEEADE